MQSLGYHVKLWLDYFVFLQLDFVVRRGEQDTHPGLTPISRIHSSFSLLALMSSKLKKIANEILVSTFLSARNVHPPGLGRITNDVKRERTTLTAKVTGQHLNDALIL